MHTDLEHALVYFGCLVVAVILHEISHGVVALWFGDRTAKDAGRLTLNPVPHIDPVGSVVLPAMGALLGVPVIAWAKPVPVNPSRLHHPRRDMVFVSLAGPFTNFMLMAVAAYAAHVVYDPVTMPGRTVYDLPLGVQILYFFALVNLFLGIFNLLPIPPLDGSSLIERVLPHAWLPHWYRVRPYGMVLLFFLVLSTGVLTKLITPFENRLFDYVFR